jgi:hypothetical protein
MQRRTGVQLLKVEAFYCLPGQILDILRESFNKNFTRVIEMWRSSLLFVSMMGKVYCCKGNGSATTITLDQKLEHENVSRKDTKAIYSMKTTLRYELRTLSLNI